VSGGVAGRAGATDEPGGDAYVHRIVPRYAEIDQQGVVFNAHWLTYFDEACGGYLRSIGVMPPKPAPDEFEMMLVKAVLEWESSARPGDEIEIAVSCPRIGRSSLDLLYRATIAGRPACTCTITYVAIDPVAQHSVPVNGAVRRMLGH
jgi:YbgC/YbaW family acyl-CoA thioester hydrolase